MSEYVNKVFKPWDRVKRIGNTKTLASWDVITKWQEYIVTSFFITPYGVTSVHLEWITWTIWSWTLELVSVKFKVGDIVRRINEDFEDIQVWLMYIIKEIDSEWLYVEWPSDMFSLDSCNFELVSSAVPLSCNGNDLCHVIVTEKNGVRTPHVSHYSNPNPISLMSEKSFNDYAIEAFMSDAHNREEATNTAKVLETLDTNLELVLNEIQKIRKVISRDRINLSDAMKYCNIELITRIISENPAVEEFVNRFMENKLVSLIPEPVVTSTSIQDKFK